MLKKLVNTVKENKKNVIIATLLIALLALLCFKSIIYNTSVGKLDYEYSNTESNVGGVWDITEIWQTFKPGKDNFTGFSLRFGTFQRVNNGTITVELFCEPLTDNTLLFSQTFQAKELSDNIFKQFYFDSLDGVQDRELAIRVTADGVADLPVTLWTSSSDVYEGALFINGVQTTTDLNIRLYYSNAFGFTEILIILIFALAIFAVFFTCKKKMFIFSDKIPINYCKFAIIILEYILLISTVRAYVSADFKMQYRINVLPLVLFTAILVLVLIFERRFRLFGSVFSKFKRIFKSLSDKISDFKETKKLKLLAEIVIRISEALFISALCITMTVLLMFNILTPATSVLIFILTVVTCSLIIVKLVFFEENLNIPKIFLCIVIVFCIFMSYGFPPSSDYLWDSEIHYTRAVDLKAMLFGAERTFYDQQMELKHVYQYNHFFVDSEHFIKVLTLDRDTPTSIPNSTVNIFHYIGYLPSAFILAVTQMLSMSLIPAITFARYINALLFAVLIYRGLKKLKSGKLLFSAVALIPCNMLLCSGFTYDFWVTAFITYGFATFVSELQNPDKKITSETVFLILSAFFLGCGPKMVYFAMMIPLLFIGPHKFTEKSAHTKYIITCLCTCAIILISFAVPFFVDVGASSDIRGGADVNSSEQLAFILGSPFEYAGILFNFMMEYVSLKNMNIGISDFCYFGVPNMIYGTIGIFVILFAMFTDKKDDIYPRRKRLTVITLLTCVVQVALVATALYIAFTPVKHYTVNGCQYRYLFPIMIPFFYFLGTNKIENNLSEKVNSLIIFALSSVSVFGSVYEVYISRILAII